jgi:hypothetical protein
VQIQTQPTFLQLGGFSIRILGQVGFSGFGVFQRAVYQVACNQVRMLIAQNLDTVKMFA